MAAIKYSKPPDRTRSFIFVPDVFPRSANPSRAPDQPRGVVNGEFFQHFGSLNQAQRVSEY
jgi:hypothetical protein